MFFESFLRRKVFTLRAAFRSHPGRIRKKNEDAARLCSGGKTESGAADQGKSDAGQDAFEGSWSGDSECFAAAVADGMGGESYGELASMSAVRHLHPAPFRDIRERAAADILRANAEICKEIAARGARMGSTLAALYIDGSKGYAVNLGDSPVFLLREGKFTRLSEDHTRIAQMLRQGLLSKEEARRHPKRHALTQHLGIEEEEFVIEPSWSGLLELQSGDRFLLCSDGLSDPVEEEEIARLLEAAPSPEEACESLLQAALDAGGRDNVTVLAVYVG